MHVPEPACDIRAQLAAVMDPDHPKRACFLAPEDAGQIPYVLNAYIEARPEGVLVTRDEDWANAFRCAPSDTDAFDRTMADILGYPEAKPDVVARCGGDPLSAVAVQACDFDGSVITEAFVSPTFVATAEECLAKHGEVVRMTPVEAIARRLWLRA